MANGNLPPLTVAGIRRLIARLDVDNASVQQSGAPAPMITKVSSLIASVQTDLDAAAQHPDDLTSWVVVIKPDMSKLTHWLELILPGPLVTGACVYSGGCIDTTAAQCAELGGIFDPGHSCT